MTAILRDTEGYGFRPFQTGDQQWKILVRLHHLSPAPLIKAGGPSFSHETGRTPRLQESPALRQPDRGQACLHGRGLGMRHLRQAQSDARQGWIPSGRYFVPPFTRPGCQIQGRSSSVHAARAESLNLSAHSNYLFLGSLFFGALDGHESARRGLIPQPPGGSGSTRGEQGYLTKPGSTMGDTWEHNARA